MKENLGLFSFEIDTSDMAAIERMDRGGGVAWAAGDPMVTD
jgi:diketogulonate reductase-like aldo/keto reductase